MSVAVKTIPNSTAISAIGSCSGSVTYQNSFEPRGAVDLRGVVDLLGDRRQPRDHDHGRERDQPPGVHGDDRREREVAARRATAAG